MAKCNEAATHQVMDYAGEPVDYCAEHAAEVRKETGGYTRFRHATRPAKCKWNDNPEWQNPEPEELNDDNGA